jgi:hypothetical protein
MTYVLVLLLGQGLVIGNYNSLDSCDHSGKLSQQKYVCLPIDKQAVARPKATVPLPRPAPAAKVAQ